MNRAGPVLDFTAWLSDEVNTLAYAKGKPLPWVRERVKLRLQEAFGRDVPVVFAIEEEFNTGTRTFHLHLHGILQLDPRRRTRKLAREALRKALGTWEGKAKNRQIWLRRDPDCGWPAYFTKRCFLATARMRARMRGFGADHRWVTTFDGPVLTMTNDVRSEARELHAEARQLVMNARRGISSPASKKRPAALPVRAANGQGLLPELKPRAALLSASMLSSKLPMGEAACQPRSAYGIKRLPPGRVLLIVARSLHPWQSRGPPSSLDVPQSSRNPTS
jgi:hypothetical protein